MHRFALPIALFACIAIPSFAQKKDFDLHDGDRVVFYGDSITDQRNYTMMIETYVLTRYPNMHIVFTHSGWGGDRVSGGGGGDIDVRLKRDVTAYSPTVVTIMLGMNDGGYKAATETSDKTFFDGYRHIYDVLKRDDPAARVTLIQPSPYDDVTRVPAFPVMDGSAYNQVLVGYGKWIGEFAKDHNLTVADGNTDFVHMLERANKTDPSTAKEILSDHIHPSFGGALMLGEAVLKAWGARSVVASVAVHADGTKVRLEHADHAIVTDLANTDGKIHWTELDDALPLPFTQWEQMWGAGPTVGLVIGSSDIAPALNNEPMQIAGLKSGVYSIRIDGASIGTFTNDELARGINLALLKTPMTDQAMSVYQLTTQHCDLHFDRWRHIEVPFTGLQAASSALSSVDALEAGVVQKQRETALPKSHTFEVVMLQ